MGTARDGSSTVHGAHIPLVCLPSQQLSVILVTSTAPIALSLLEKQIAFSHSTGVLLILLCF